MSTAGKRCAAVEHADVVEPKEAALEHVLVVSIFFVDPPSEIQQQFVEHGFQKVTIRFAMQFLFDLIDTPRCPSMNGWVHVAERPFISRDLPVGVHVPFARHQDQLFFGKHRIHLRNRNAMECEIPSRVPRVLPLVGHRNDV